MSRSTVTSFFARPHGAAQAFLIAGAVWMVVGVLYGLVSAIHLVAPEVFDGPALVFSRARPAHVNTVIYGFAVSLLIGAGLYYVPGLLKTKLWSEPLAWVSFVCWTAAVASGPVTFAMGWTSGREYTEYVWFADMLLMIAVIAMIGNLIMTMVRRKEDLLYVSVWYFVGTFLWMTGHYPIGNVMWRPEQMAVSGVSDEILLWFYGHNLPGLILTPIATGAAYFVLPRVSKTPLYSHALSLIGFWTLLALYSHIGAHHIIQAPIPDWLKVIGQIDSMLMVIPVAAVLANLWMTIRGRTSEVMKDIGGRFVLFGSFWYLLTCIQGPLQSMAFMQRVTHFNNWTVGHSHIAILGFAGFIALGALWHTLPNVCGRKLYSNFLAGLQFGLLMFGLTGFAIVLTIAGLIQGEAWDNGELVVRVLPQIHNYMIVRLMLGMSIVVAAFVGLYNVLMTVWKGEPLPRPPAPGAEGAR